MDTLISILLFMNVITADGHYTVNDINNFGLIYAPQITAIKMNPPQLEAVLGEEEPTAFWVIDNLGA